MKELLLIYDIVLEKLQQIIQDSSDIEQMFLVKIIKIVLDRLGEQKNGKPTIMPSKTSFDIFNAIRRLSFPLRYSDTNNENVPKSRSFPSLV